MNIIVTQTTPHCTHFYRQNLIKLFLLLNTAHKNNNVLVSNHVFLTNKTLFLWQKIQKLTNLSLKTLNKTNLVCYNCLVSNQESRVLNQKC